MKTLKKIKQKIKQNPKSFRFFLKMYNIGYNTLYTTFRIAAFFIPVKKNRVVIQNFNGQGFGSFPGVLAETISEKFPELEIVWLASKKPDNLPSRIKWVRNTLWKTVRATASSSIWIFNVKTVRYAFKKKRQLYIQTWHGHVGIKFVEKEASDTLPKWYVKKSISDSAITDIYLSESKWKTELIQRAFWYSGPILPTEYYTLPRGDDLASLKDTVHEALHIPSQTHTILYAPTFRNRQNLDWMDLDFNRLIGVMSHKYGGQWAVIVRLHPNIVFLKDNIQYSDTVFDGSMYPDIMDLVYTSDMYITDYSSPMFNALRAGVKTIMYASDMDAYQHNDRSFYFDVNELHIPLAQSNDELEKIILSFDEEKYKNAVEHINNQIGYYYDNKDLSNLMKVISSHCQKT